MNIRRSVSDAAYEDVRWRAGTQKHMLLKQWAQGDELTVREAAELAGLGDKEFWARGVEMRQKKLIRGLGRTRENETTGSCAELYRVTTKGLMVLLKLEDR